MTSKRLRYNRITVHSRQLNWSVIGISVLIIGLILLLRSVIAPFLAAAILAYVLMPVQRLLSRKLNTNLAAAITLSLALSGLVILFLVIFPLFVKQFAELLQRLPRVLLWLNDVVIPWFNYKFGYSFAFESDQIATLFAEHAQELGQLAGKILPSLGSGGMAVVGLLANVFLIPLVLFYALRDGGQFTANLKEHLPPRYLKKLGPIGQDIDAVMGEFLRGQISVMLLMSVYYCVFLSFTGVDYALPIGLVAGLLVFIPYIGMLTGLLLATLCAWLQFGNSIDLIWVWIVFGSGQVLEGMVVTPYLVGNRIGLHPVAVLFALMAFGQLLGFTGIMLALPLAATLLVAWRHIKPSYYSSRFYKG